VPIPLIHCGLLPEPHPAPGADTATLGGMSADDLREFFRHALLTLHPCFVLLTWAGHEVAEMLVAQRAAGAPSGTPARLEIATMEIGEGSWTPPDGPFPDGTYFVLVLRARPGLPAPPLALTVLGSPVSEELSMLVDDSAPFPWDKFGLLGQLAGFAATVSDGLRTSIRAARGAAVPAFWIRDPQGSGFMSMYDYTSWRFDVLEGAPGDWWSPIRRVGEDVWTAITASGEEFDRFLDEEPARADGRDILRFPGGPSVSAFRRVLDYDHGTQTAASDALAHNVDAANLVRPGLLKAADLKLLSYTELLAVLAEAGVVDIAPVTPLSGEALREQILLRLEELGPLAKQVLGDLHIWTDANCRNFAHSLEGEIPSYASQDWWGSLWANVLAEILGTGAPFATESLVTWIAGAGAGLSVGPLTVIGFTVGLGASVVLGDLLAPSEAEQAARITAIAERILYFEELWLGKVQTATDLAEGRIDDEIEELERRVDPFTDEALLRDLYSKVLADLEVCAARPVPPPGDLSLADANLYGWLLHTSWGFTPYDDEGHLTPTNGLMAKIRDRILVWPRENNPTLFLSQCAYEWRSLGFVAESVLQALVAEATTSAADNAQRFQGRTFSFWGAEIDPTFRTKWQTRYGTTLGFEPGADEGSTRVTERGLTEIGFGRFTARCTLRLAVTEGSCRVAAFDYRLEGNGDFFAEIFIDPEDEATTLEIVPNTYHDYTVVPDRPTF
jgi:hypothetical protein